MQTRVITYTRSQPEVVVRMTRAEADRLKLEIERLSPQRGTTAMDALWLELESALDG